MLAQLTVVGFLILSHASGSPVQKVIELLEENKEKITTDLAAEEKEMTEYSDFCDSEASAKGFAIKTAMSKMEDLQAVVQECEYKIPGYQDEVATQGSLVAGKEKELADAKAIRVQERKDFSVTESELVTAVGQLDRAASIIKTATASFLQGRTAADAQASVKLAVQVLNKVIDASHVNLGSDKSLESLLQTGTFASDEGEEEQGQHEGKSSDIVAKIEEMKEKAEETLTQARDAETKANNDFAMFELSLTNAIKIAKDKIAAGTASAGAKAQEMGEAKEEIQKIAQAKAADEKYLSTLKKDCEEAAHGWEERQVSARGEIGAINKAIGILSEGVRVFLQVSSKTRRSANSLVQDDQQYDDAADTMSATSRTRHALVQKLKDLSHQFGSYALMEMAGTAAMDPFAKIKGLIEEMIDKLLQEAQEEATQKAFCDQELGKSKKAKADKTARAEKLQTRLDTATTKQAELQQAVKELEAEIAELDQAMAKATGIRQEEHATYLTSSKDFKDAATAVESAIKVLKDFYEGSTSFLQTSARQQSEEDEDEDDGDLSGSKGSDAGSVIIGILEMCGEDFTKLLMETETEESQAQEAFDKLMLESKVAKAAKAAEAKSSLSQIKSLGVTAKDTSEDYGMTTKELEAVSAYMDELKPQCETKTMSYAEKKARREAEIEGLKDALSILSGTGI